MSMSSPTLCFCLCRSCVRDDSLRHLSANSAVSALSGFRSSPSKFLHPLCLTLVLPLLQINTKKMMQKNKIHTSEKNENKNNTKAWNSRNRNMTNAANQKDVETASSFWDSKWYNSGKFLSFWHKIILVRTILFHYAGQKSDPPFPIDLTIQFHQIRWMAGGRTTKIQTIPFPTKRCHRHRPPPMQKFSQVFAAPNK